MVNHGRYYCVVEITTGKEIYCGHKIVATATCLVPGTVYASGRTPDEARKAAKGRAAYLMSKGNVKSIRIAQRLATKR